MTFVGFFLIRVANAMYGPFYFKKFVISLQTPNMFRESCAAFSCVAVLEWWDEVQVVVSGFERCWHQSNVFWFLVTRLDTSLYTRESVKHLPSSGHVVAPPLQLHSFIWVECCVFRIFLLWLAILARLGMQL